MGNWRRCTWRADDPGSLPGQRQTLSNITGGFTFDPLRDILYGVDATADQVIAYDTHTWQERYRIAIGEDVSAVSGKFSNG